VKESGDLGLGRSGDPPCWTRQAEEYGFAILSDVLNHAEVERLLDCLAGVESQRGRAGVRHLLRNSAVAALANDFRLLAIAQAILGSAAFPFRATLFHKSPDSNWLITWHQDTAVPLQARHETAGWGPWSMKESVTYVHAPASALQEILALRVHLDASTDENGPLRVLPSTHTMGVLSDDAISELARKTADVSCLAPAGGILVMRPLLIHASSKSQAGASSRRVLHIEYASRVRFAPNLQLAIA
jgi:ectoine hydroxylase-related dioxygenase (phytanoyl-CoA dioxygenase family)